MACAPARPRAALRGLRGRRSCRSRRAAGVASAQPRAGAAAGAAAAGAAAAAAAAALALALAPPASACAGGPAAPPRPRAAASVASDRPLPAPAAGAEEGAPPDAQAPATVTLSARLQEWLRQEKCALGFSTYTYGKVFLIGPGATPDGGPAMSQTSFDKAMALSPTPSGRLRVSTAAATYTLDNALRGDSPPYADGSGGKWDRVLAPRAAHFTGKVDAHEIVETPDGRVLAACTAFNCVAELDSDKGSISPFWMPPFMSSVKAADCCHLNGFCMDEKDGNRLAYATVVGPSDESQGWRAHRTGGGQVWDCRRNRVVCEGLSMPHSPRMHNGKLWVLEAGTGWLGWVDLKASPKEAFRRHAWLPGFARGLRFSPSGDFAVVGLSMPRYEVFSDLPLGAELERRGEKPRCGVFVLELETGQPRHAVMVGGAITELYDVAILEGTVRQVAWKDNDALGSALVASCSAADGATLVHQGAPLGVGASRAELERWVRIGDNTTGREVGS